jgi:4-hydroxy-3-methylbut-2-enyl diphosphate reductase
MKDSEKNISGGFSDKRSLPTVLQESYYSELIEQIKAAGYELTLGDIVFCLAEQFGFCYGVDRAVDLAYATRKRFPERNIYLTSEIIHNPRVNAKLRELGVKFLDDKKGIDSDKVFDIVKAGDVVLIPAFGTPAEVLNILKEKGCVLVDTTCGSVMAVWRRVEQYAKDGFTAVIHGKFNHEETQATCSRIMQYPNGKYVVIRDKKQAEKVCAFISGKLDRAEFIKEFSATCSKGFDPENDLERIGCANQTTMLSSESIDIAGMIQGAMRNRFGEKELPDRFRHFDTVCSATQDRQDAVLKLARSGIDLMVVVGGYNSSNTAHLCEIASQFSPTFHVQDADEILSSAAIKHKPVGKSGTVTSQNWLPEGKVKIGITAGASTPNRVIEEVIRRIASLREKPS